VVRELPSIRAAARLLEELKETDEDTAGAKEALEERVLEILLEGQVNTARGVALTLGDIDFHPFVKEIIWSADFQAKLMQARKDPTISGIDRIKRKTHRLIRNMEEMSESYDGRVAFAATQDLLNRAGTSPAQRVEVGPLAYLKAIEGLTEDEGNPDKPK